MTTWPEDDWERLTPYVAVDLTAVQAKIEPRATALTILPGGKANTNYRVDLDDTSVVLRLYERDRSARDRERRVLELVADAVPTARILDTGTLDGVGFAVLEFVDGQSPHHALADGADAHQVGVELGRGLAALETVEPPGGRETIGLLGPDLEFTRTFTSVADSFVDLIAWSLCDGRAGKRLGPELRKALAGQLDEAARMLEPIDSWRGLTHGDYKFSNLLVRDAALVAVLDWEFASAFTPLLDVAIMMRHRDTFPADFITGFEAGHGDLPDDWRELSRIIDLMNLVGFLNAAGDRPALFEHVRRRVRRTIELLRRLRARRSESVGKHDAD